MSREADRLADSVLSGLALSEEAANELRRRISDALDQSWQQGFRDCETKARLEVMGLTSGLDKVRVTK